MGLEKKDKSEAGSTVGKIVKGAVVLAVLSFIGGGEIMDIAIDGGRSLATALPIIVIVVIVIAIILSTIFVVRQQTIAIMERFGKFTKVKGPGIHIRAPFGIDKVAIKVNLRIQQIDIDIETKTKDNVFIQISVSTQYKVDPQKVTDSYYQLENPRGQIAAYIEDSIRSAMPTLILDEAFEKKEDIALQVQGHLADSMSGYGYNIVKTLITSIEPAEEVKNSMNEINAAQRKRAAAQELAEADRIKVVTAAKAEAEKNKLHGEGIAAERRAIVDGLTKSFEELQGSGLAQEQVFSILLSNQYLDALHDFASNGNSTIFLPSGPTGADDIRGQVLEALAAGGSVSSFGKKVSDEKNKPRKLEE